MGKKILVIDDDADFVEAISTLLEAKGYVAISSSESKDGFAKAKKEIPDLILLDVMMTTKSEGLDAAKQLKTEIATKDIPVIMITGVRKEMNLPFSFEPDEDWLPVKAIIEKPVKPDVLLKAIEDNIKK